VKVFVFPDDFYRCPKCKSADTEILYSFNKNKPNEFQCNVCHHKWR
jgi:hypothetical protein